ncbi:Wall-associated receptor kinase 2 [Platanthera guangdongensis]|uniref:Wall-associated receptor kinase 2 n=1 Tax=Platanthera guangdongensis TaxID=2320717 RepID=A0ABR2LYL4_9ASPA
MLPLFPILLPLLFISPSSSSAGASAGTLPDCPDRCGNVSIPFPFGTQRGCHLPGFLIACNNSSSSPPKPLLAAASGNIELSSISLSPGSATVLAPIIRHCNSSGTVNSSIDVSNLPFALSARNKFTAVGCNTLAIYSYNTYTSGCLSFCNNADKISTGSCSGIGCCQTAIPSGLQRIQTTLGSMVGNASNSADCSYAFVVDQEKFEFSPLNVTDFSAAFMPLVLDWAVAGTCSRANSTCGKNAYCSNATSSTGHLCSCNSGFAGNPYLIDGCQDINECEDPNSSPCSNKCKNTPGSYVCSCPGGYRGDGIKAGTGCTEETKRFPLVQVVIGTGLGFLFLLLAGSYLFWVQKKRKLMGLKEQFFQKNGGLFLQQRLAAQHGLAETPRIYTAEELERATDNYSDGRILGRGGNGTVYRGIFPNTEHAVAIKKSRRVDASQIEQFINEVVLLSQVIHKHVVRILGCCLETQVPLLVYEFVPNNTLHHHIHDKHGSLSWETRLRVAAETAAALAYLHSAIERPIFHRDVKAANILLDDKLTAKVSDFGASRLLPLDRAQVTTMVQGTLGYLDPEYFQSGQLTEKSDVYSFGVVMAEILTGQRPISSARLAAEKNLGVYFVGSLTEGKLMEILEGRVREEGSGEQLLAVAEVTRRCLLMNGEERPTMREVAAELERARRWIPGKSLWGTVLAAAGEVDDGEWRICRGECGSSIRSGSIGHGFGYLDCPATRECESLLFVARNCNSSSGSSTSTVESMDARSIHTMMALDIQR